VLSSYDFETELGEEEFRLLRDLIHEQFGLFFEDNQKDSLRTRLASRLTTLDLFSFEDYYRYLRFGPQREQELKRMISNLTNNETYFYREVTQLNAFAENVLPEIKERKYKSAERTLSILSAGCSTGEEVYTLGMLVYDSGQFFWGWDVRVIGLDIDPIALEKARKGLYFHNSFRGVDPALQEKHFIPTDGGYQVKDGIRKMTEFRQGSILAEASYGDLPPLDVVLCRNVLIYFSEGMTLRAVSRFDSALAEEGYLLLGHAESLARLTTPFAPLRFRGAMIYQGHAPGAAS
jgi:chemotaxis protein methyltransferase CheR